MIRSRTQLSARTIAAALGVAFVASGARAASFTPLGVLEGDVSSHPVAISGDGSTIVGTSRSASGSQRAFIWDRVHGMRALFDPAAEVGSAARDITADGSTVFALLGDRFVLWDEAGGPRSLDIGFAPSLMSADGSTFAGRSGDSTVVWDAENGIRDLGQLPGGNAPDALRISADGSTIVGRALTDRGEEAFVWTAASGIQAIGESPGSAGFFPGSAIGVSGDGSTVVGGRLPEVGREAFVWDAENGMMGLGDLPPGVGEFLSIATDVSADGSTVVGVGGTGTFVWDEERGLRDLDVVLASLGLDLDGWILDQLVFGESMPRISADGRTIIGTGLFQGRPTAYIAVIPEPSTALLFGLGLIALATAPRAPSDRACPPAARP
ncbi:MAG: PEP-CTERM sorting domain-containing protein [Myxococcota bacterium]